MKRDDIKAKISGITDEQLDWLMAEHGKSVNEQKDRADTLQTQLNTATDGLKAFEGVDVQALRDEIKGLQDKLTAQADAHAFDAELDEGIRARHGRNLKAVRGMLDVEALRASKNRTQDIAAALDAAVKSDPWAFGDGQPTGATVATAADHGTGGTAQPEDGVMAAFRALNPEINL